MPDCKERGNLKEIPQKKCDIFNEIPEGFVFQYYPYLFDEESDARSAWLSVRTIGQAFVSEGGVAVVFVSNHDEYVSIENLKLVE